MFPGLLRHLRKSVDRIIRSNHLGISRDKAGNNSTYAKLLASFAKLHLIVLDDFGLAKLNSDNRRDLLELLEDRYATRSTLVTSQLPIENWHDALGDPTFADAILDRLVHNAYKLKLKGGSMRKKKAPLTQADH